MLLHLLFEKRFLTIIVIYIKQKCLIKVLMTRGWSALIKAFIWNPIMVQNIWLILLLVEILAMITKRKICSYLFTYVWRNFGCNAADTMSSTVHPWNVDMFGSMVCFVMVCFASILPIIYGIVSLAVGKILRLPRFQWSNREWYGCTTKGTLWQFKL